MTTVYRSVIEALKTLDKDQLFELLHDIDDVETVMKISEVVVEFLMTEVVEVVRESDDEISDEQDAINVDDARRARELR